MAENGVAQPEKPSGSALGAVRAFAKRFSKALGAAVGGLTPAALVGLLALLHVHLDITTAGFLAPLFAGLGAGLAPRNDYNA